MKNKKLAPIHPGEILIEEFLKPLGLSQYRLAKDISVPPRRINEIVHGKRSIIGISLILAGSIWFLWSLHSLWKGRESEDWNITTGIITKSKVFEPYRKGNPAVPIVHYEYSLCGKTYKSDRIFWGNVHTSGTLDSAQKIVGKYREGTNVSVYDNQSTHRTARSAAALTLRNCGAVH